MNAGQGGAAAQDVHYDLDSSSDAFWRENRARGWQDIGPALKTARESYQSESEAVKALQLATGATGDELLAKVSKPKKKKTDPICH